jgi:lysophospholipase L1-like esterase
MNKMIICYALSLLMAGGPPSPWARNPKDLDWTMHWNARSGVIADQYEQAGPGRPILLGDSLTERLWQNTINGGSCGVINAGFGGIDLWNLSIFSEYFLKGRKFSAVVLLVGTNDVNNLDARQRLRVWKKRYSKLVKLIRKSGAQLVVITIPPIEKTQQPYISIKQIAELNDHIRKEAKANHLGLVDVYSAWVGPDGLAPPGSTSDGIHLSAAKSLELWQLIEKGINDAMRISGQACLGAN